MRGLRLALWLAWHSRHGTGPLLRHRTARKVDTKGVAYGPARTVSYYRCECTATRKAPA